MSSFSVSFQIVPMSPDCPFLIAPSVFSNFYFLGMSMQFKMFFFISLLHVLMDLSLLLKYDISLFRYHSNRHKRITVISFFFTECTIQKPIKKKTDKVFNAL